MKSFKMELLSAVAAAALITTAGGAIAQDKQTGGAQGGAQIQAQPGGAGAQGQGGATTRTQTAPGGAGAQGQAQGGTDKQTGGAKGGAQIQAPAGGTQTGQGGMQDRERPGQAQQQGQDGSKRQQQTQGGDTEKPAQLNETQRTQISSTLREKNVNLKRVERTNINFNINVGAVVPRTIGLVPLPAPIVAVVPAYRGFLYIVVGDDLLIVHPRTYEIVAVIPA